MPMNRPTAAELLRAVRISLEHTDVADSAASGYERRIAVNVLKILEREAILGGPFLLGEQQELSSYLGIQATGPVLNAALCDRIAQGREDLRWKELVGLLRRITLGKVAVDNPTFAAYRRIIDQPERSGGNS